MAMTKKLLDLTGIGGDRLHVDWVSSADAKRFTEIVIEATEKVRKRGPLDPSQYELQLQAADLVVKGEVMRWLVGKQHKITSDGDVYGRPWEEEKFQRVIDDALLREYQKSLIYLAIKSGTTSVRGVAEQTGIEVLRVSYLLADLEQMKLVELKGMEESIPVFAAL
jgi:hypothetical protein